MSIKKDMVSLDIVSLGMVLLGHSKIFRNGRYQISLGELEITTRAVREYHKNNCGEKCPSKDLCSGYDSCPNLCKIFSTSRVKYLETKGLSVGELEIIARALREYHKKNCGKKCPSKDLCSAFDSCPDLYLDIAEGLKVAGYSKRVFPDEEVRRNKDSELL